MEYFRNNARGVLPALAANATEVNLVTEADAEKFARPDDPAGLYMFGAFSRATIEHPDHPELALEIVRIEGVHDYTKALTLHRGQEGTTAKTWPAGAVITARVTAEMLASFLQCRADASGYVARQVFGNESPALAKASSLMATPWAWNGQSSHPTMQSQPVVMEGVFQSGIYNFGVPETHDPAKAYRSGAVVAPVTPDDGYYTLYMRDKGATAVGPAVLDSPTQIYDDQGEAVGAWVWADSSVVEENFSSSSGEGLLLTECGVICHEIGLGATLPTFSIGTPDAPTAFAFGEELTAMSMWGQRSGILRMRPPDAFQKLVQDLRFTLVDPSDGVCNGYFYCRGVWVRT